MWWLANDPLLLEPNDLSGEELMEATMEEGAPVWQRQVFTLERKVPVGTFALQRSSSMGNEIECVKSVGKVNHTLRVKLSHPYIGVCVNNPLHEMRRLIRRLLENTCMVSVARGRTLVGQGALLLVHSFGPCTLVWWMFDPRVSVGLTFQPVYNTNYILLCGEKSEFYIAIVIDIPIEMCFCDM